MTKPSQLGHYAVDETLLETPSVSVYLARMSWGDGQSSTVVLKSFDKSTLPVGLSETDLYSGIERYRALVGESLVRLLDVFEADERVVLVLEHVEGMGLDTLLSKLQERGTPLDDDAALYLMSKVFNALSIAHEARVPSGGDRAPIVHGEVQPSAIVVTPDGRVCLGEFPLTTFVAPWRSILTTKDRITSNHLAPEQVTRGVATLRSDIFSAALVLWELLARRSHADMSSRDIDRLVRLAEPEIIPLERYRPELDLRLLDVVRRCLVVGESLRTMSAADIAKTLEWCAPSDVGRTKLRQAVARVVDISSPLGPASFAVQRTSMAPTALLSAPRRKETLLGFRPPAEALPSEVSFSGLDIVGSALTDSSSGIGASPFVGTWANGETASDAAPTLAVPLPDYSNLSVGVDPDPDDGFASAPPPRAGHGKWLGAAALLAALGGGGWFYMHANRPEPPAPRAPDQVSPPVTMPVPTFDASIPEDAGAIVDAGKSTDAGTANNAGATWGQLPATPPGADGIARVSTASWPKGFRVFVDGVVVGETPKVFEVKCGPHKVKVGSAGVSKSVQIACGSTYEATR